MNEDRSAQNPGRLTGFLPVRMRGPADMAEMLPYLLGFFPDDSIVAVGLQGPELQQGGVIRVDIPRDPVHWPKVARETARLLIELSEQRDRRPEQVLVYLCRDPAPAGVESGGRSSVAELGPLARQLTEAFAESAVTVKESLCVSGGRWWSFLCTGPDCCDPAGTAIRSSQRPSPLAAAATFAGLAPKGSRKAIISSLGPIESAEAELQRAALESAGPPFIRELGGPGGRAAAIERTSALLAEAMGQFRAGARALAPEQAARLLVGLQDKLGRDRGAEYTEPDELVAAQRLWRYLAQRCVPPFEHLAAPPMTLLAWTSWLAGDTAMARIVLARTLELEPEYTLAQLLHESLNGGLLPDLLLESVRRERAGRELAPPAGGGATASVRPDGPAGDAEPAPAPGDAVPGGPVPGDTPSGESVPDGAGPGGAGPGGSARGDSAPGDSGPGGPGPGGSPGGSPGVGGEPVSRPYRRPGRRLLLLRARPASGGRAERRGPRAVGG